MPESRRPLTSPASGFSAYAFAWASRTALRGELAEWVWTGRWAPGRPEVHPRRSWRPSPWTPRGPVRTALGRALGPTCGLSPLLQCLSCNTSYEFLGIVRRKILNEWNNVRVSQFSEPLDTCIPYKEIPIPSCSNERVFDFPSGHRISHLWGIFRVEHLRKHPACRVSGGVVTAIEHFEHRIDRGIAERCQGARRHIARVYGVD